MDTHSKNTCKYEIHVSWIRSFSSTRWIPRASRWYSTKRRSNLFMCVSIRAVGGKPSSELFWATSIFKEPFGPRSGIYIYGPSLSPLASWYGSNVSMLKTYAIASLVSSITERRQQTSSRGRMTWTATSCMLPCICKIMEDFEGSVCQLSRFTTASLRVCAMSGMTPYEYAARRPLSRIYEMYHIWIQGNLWRVPPQNPRYSTPSWWLVS